VIDAVRSLQGSLRHVAVVGLGTGALACYRHRGEAWTFYEIDPAVVQIGRDPHFFTFISACAPDLPVVVGDARLTLAASTEKYDLIVLDAFSSDLLTREAVEGYLNHLTGGGVIVMHISNRYMELADTVAAVGAAEGLGAFIKIDDRTQTSSPDYKMNAEVVAGKAPRGRRRSKSPARLASDSGNGRSTLDRRLFQYLWSNYMQAK
jgi:spermidine synthase